MSDPVNLKECWILPTTLPPLPPNWKKELLMTEIILLVHRIKVFKNLYNTKTVSLSLLKINSVDKLPVTGMPD